MKYTTPQMLNVKTASSTIMGHKVHLRQDSKSISSTTVAYRSDE